MMQRQMCSNQFEVSEFWILKNNDGYMIYVALTSNFYK